MSDEIDLNYKYVIFGILLIAALLTGIYVGGIKPKQEVQQVKTLFSSCQDYCNALNETGYVRYEQSDTHYKCFCYSDRLKRMEGR